MPMTVGLVPALDGSQFPGLTLRSLWSDLFQSARRDAVFLAREGREGGRDAVRLSGVGIWMWIYMGGCLQALPAKGN